MIPFAVIALLGVLLLVFLILSAKSWRVLHLTMLFLVFVAMSASLLFISKAFRVQNAWQQRHLENVRLADEQTEAYYAAVYGDDKQISLQPNTYLGSSALLEESRVGRGRVWERVRATAGTNANEVSLTLLGSDNEAIDANSLQPDTILFVFENNARPEPGEDGLAQEVPEGELAPELQVADRYIGSIRIASIAGNSINAEALFVANQEAFDSKSRTWAMYERAPSDNYGIFRQAAGITEDPSSADLNVNEYQERIRPVIKFYMPKDKMGFASDSEYESFVDQFAFDGMRLNAIREWSTANGNRRFDPDLNQVWDAIEFTQPSQEFPVDASEAITLKGADQIDDSGLAVSPGLKNGGDVSFEAGQVVLIDAATARNGIVRDGNVIIPPLYDPNDLASNTKLKVSYSIYRRELIDYPSLLKTSRELTQKMQDRMQRVAANSKLAEESVNKLQDQINTRTQLITNLKSDESRLTADLKSIQDLFTAKSEQLQQKQLRINALYLDIARMHGQIQASLDN